LRRASTAFQTNGERHIRSIREVAKDYLQSYALRNRSIAFAQGSVSQVVRLLGERMLIDITESIVREYQDGRLRENAAPKTINEGVGFLLRMLGERGEVIRAGLKKHKALKLKGSKTVANAYSAEEKERLVQAAHQGRSRTIYPALMLALNAGLRNSEIRQLRWLQIDLGRRFLTVGKSKTEAGEGRTIPLNPALYEALKEYAEWYTLRFGRIETRVVCVPVRQSKPPRPRQADHHDQDSVGECTQTCWR
jgi:integrase